MPESSRFYAHSLSDRPETEWEALDRHLREVGEMAEAFARAFDASAWGAAAGLLHDLGKYDPGFQRYIRGGGPSTPHAPQGARVARRRFDEGVGRMLAYVVAGHHAGLHDGNALDALLAKPDDGPMFDKRADDLPLPRTVALPNTLFECERNTEAGFALGFFARMVFSCLIDADRLCTERFYSPATYAERRAFDVSLAVLKERIDAHVDALGRSAAPSDVNAVRAEVQAHCRAAATEPTGAFSLTVPTGGGKTLASLAFALDHAVHHGLRRIVYVIPYTSIIEQTCDTFRDALGAVLAHCVLEHHSAFTPPTGDTEEGIGPEKLRLATENWDVPIVVTTAVQFFESLFAAHPRQTRKLHNLAQSVVILDEAQALPTRRLGPCVAALNELVGRYGSSVVLCTATQPPLTRGAALPVGLKTLREIVPDPPSLFARLRRVHADFVGALDDDTLADDIAGAPRALCIVDTRAHARTVYAAVRERLDDAAGLFHLSAAMCPAHRRAVLRRIRAALAEGRACRTIATQLVEAGVDVDFPLVYRALAGADALAQAAGRCNREGRLAELGRLVIFEAATPPAVGDLKNRLKLARPIVAKADDPLAPDTVAHFFARLFGVEGAQGLDGGGIDGCDGIVGQSLPARGRGLKPVISAPAGHTRPGRSPRGVD